MKFHRRFRNMTYLAAGAAFLWAGLAARGQQTDYSAKMKELGLPHLDGKVSTYFSPGPGHREHAQKLQSTIEDMNAFYDARLHVQADVALAMLDSKDWARVTDSPYGIPLIMGGEPPVILMPATSDSRVHVMTAARKQAIPPEELAAFLKAKQTTFEAITDQYVDLISCQILGLALTWKSGIDPRNTWFNQFLMAYWAYAYIAEKRPESKAVFDLLGRPSYIRPKNTSLEDFERLYMGVDDFGWYEGMFEERAREVYPKAGIALLTTIKKEFPSLSPGDLLERMDKIAPGFCEWGAKFNAVSSSHGPSK